MMAKKSEPGLIVGLDVGTSKIEAVVGELTEEGEIEIIGIGSSPSRGLKKGVVVNIESTVQSIQRAVEEAELMAGCEIHSVYTGIAGSHIKSYNSTGVVAIKDGEVVAGDVDRVIDAARAIAIPADQRILHVLPQEYIIDEQEGIREPIGMSGVRLEAKVHLVTGAVSAAQNIVKCVERCGLRVDDIILEQLASSYSVLSEDEKDLGVCLVDVGGGTTDIAVFAHGAIMHTAVIPSPAIRSPTTSRSRYAPRPSTPKNSRSSTPARCARWPIRARASRCPVSAIVPHAGCRARRSPPWSSLATRNCCSWCKRNCAAAAPKK